MTHIQNEESPLMVNTQTEAPEDCVCRCLDDAVAAEHMKCIKYFYKPNNNANSDSDSDSGPFICPKTPGCGSWNEFGSCVNKEHLVCAIKKCDYLQRILDSEEDMQLFYCARCGPDSHDCLYEFCDCHSPKCLCGYLDNQEFVEEILGMAANSAVNEKRVEYLVLLVERFPNLLSVAHLIILTIKSNQFDCFKVLIKIVKPVEIPDLELLTELNRSQFLKEIITFWEFKENDRLNLLGLIINNEALECLKVVRNEWEFDWELFGVATQMNLTRQRNHLTLKGLEKFAKSKMIRSTKSQCQNYLTGDAKSGIKSGRFSDPPKFTISSILVQKFDVCWQMVDAISRRVLDD
jgi:hypothetical protein